MNQQEIEKIKKFIEFEREKGVSICKKTYEALQESLSDKHAKINDFALKSYSSGRKMKPMDYVGFFFEILIKDELSYVLNSFCDEELESYSKCLRLYEKKNHRIHHFVKVFEFVKPKI